MAKASKPTSPYVIEQFGAFDTKRPLLLALDPATVAIGWALVALSDFDHNHKAYKGGDILTADVWQLEGSTVFERRRYLQTIVKNWGFAPLIQGIAVERQWVGPNPQVALNIGRSRGWVEMGFGMECDVNIWVELTPAEWKGELGGSHLLTKKGAIEVCRLRGIDLSHVPNKTRDNAADAVGIGVVAYNRWNVERLSKTGAWTRL